MLNLADQYRSNRYVQNLIADVSAQQLHNDYGYRAVNKMSSSQRSALVKKLRLLVAKNKKRGGYRHLNIENSSSKNAVPAQTKLREKIRRWEEIYD